MEINHIGQCLIDGKNQTYDKVGWNNEFDDFLRKNDNNNNNNNVNEVCVMNCKNIVAIDERFVKSFGNKLSVMRFLGNESLSDLVIGDNENDNGLSSLVILHCNNNPCLSRFPSSFAKLQQLTIVKLSNNNIDEFPSFVCDLQNLVVLDLSFNNITIVPSNLCKSSKLQTLTLRFNNIRTLPKEISALVSFALRYLILEGNPLIPPLQQATKSGLIATLNWCASESDSCSVENYPISDAEIEGLKEVRKKKVGYLRLDEEKQMNVKRAAISSFSQSNYGNDFEKRVEEIRRDNGLFNKIKDEMKQEGHQEVKMKEQEQEQHFPIQLRKINTNVGLSESKSDEFWQKEDPRVRMDAEKELKDLEEQIPDVESTISASTLPTTAILSTPVNTAIDQTIAEETEKLEISEEKIVNQTDVDDDNDVFVLATENSATSDIPADDINDASNIEREKERAEKEEKEQKEREEREERERKEREEREEREEQERIRKQKEREEEQIAKKAADDKRLKENERRQKLKLEREEEERKKREAQEEKIRLKALQDKQKIMANQKK